ncbi:unnamed protein product [Vitrella brassicaformis CCMP3155]|uniref:UBC core domain-containing protein n=1 Tax=Vitrella brassicaformis (strain CCMP3155) TaxID=1169540 RepID=A0A0G4FF27_VITBC|nr:unnamed protein product [Vitrella brassicaformis CCMP3155]|eukprot:CEM11435.1 unnamed protein product [Vitrella brassicaformis CCMP3155]
MLANRMKAELKMLVNEPPEGVCISTTDSIQTLSAEMCGPEGTAYAGGVFRLSISVPDRYPLVPPDVKFETPVFHPNIEQGGRICVDLLKAKPHGSWTPLANIRSLMMTIRCLLSEPNAKDPLNQAALLERSPQQFDATASQWTKQHAMQSCMCADGGGGGGGGGAAGGEDASTSANIGQGEVRGKRGLLTDGEGGAKRAKVSGDDGSGSA